MALIPRNSIACTPRIPWLAVALAIVTTTAGGARGALQGTFTDGATLTFTGLPITRGPMVLNNLEGRITDNGKIRLTGNVSHVTPGGGFEACPTVAKTDFATPPGKKIYEKSAGWKFPVNEGWGMTFPCPPGKEVFVILACMNENNLLPLFGCIGAKFTCPDN